MPQTIRSSGDQWPRWPSAPGPASAITLGKLTFRRDRPVATGFADGRPGGLVPQYGTKRQNGRPRSRQRRRYDIKLSPQCPSSADRPLRSPCRPLKQMLHDDRADGLQHVPGLPATASAATASETVSLHCHRRRYLQRYEADTSRANSRICSCRPNRVFQAVRQARRTWPAQILRILVSSQLLC